ncbi:MAG: hypothetical protein IIC91_10780 [Chloroflexi bacterium]|nr:hypothetical protein [Chloroflexota bacterium]
MKPGLFAWVLVASALVALAGVSAWAVSGGLLPMFRDSPSLSEAEVLTIFHEELLYVPPPLWSDYEKASSQEKGINIEKSLMGLTLSEALVEAEREELLALPAEKLALGRVTLDWDGRLPLSTSFYVNALKRVATYDGNDWWAISFNDHTWRLNETTKQIVPVSAAAQEFLTNINPAPPTTPDTFEQRLTSLIGQVDNILSDLAIMDNRLKDITATRPRARPVASYQLSTEDLIRSLTGDPNDPFRIVAKELDVLTAQAAELWWQLGEIERMRPAENLPEFVGKVDEVDRLRQQVDDRQKELDELWTRIDGLDRVVESP